jgi:hypothetical protein
MSRHNGLPGYDAWKTRSDLDDAAMANAADDGFICPLSGDPCPHGGEECDDSCAREILAADKVTAFP